MMNLKQTALGTVVLIGMVSGGAHAGNSFLQGALHTSYAESVHNLSDYQQQMLADYLNYEQREPCQFYQPIPKGFIRDGCDIKYKTYPMKKARTMQKEKKPAKPQPKDELHLSDVVVNYEIHFAYDSAVIEPEGQIILDKVLKEINDYKPSEVTIAGHADKAGPAAYNVKLSERRASAVSKALHERGVENRILEQEAYGENWPAVPTEDGVALRENRRVVINFHE